MKILAFETSCDETSCAVVEDGKKVLSCIIASQIDIFKNYGGVIPEIASREHIKQITQCYEKALEEANITMNNIDLIATTTNPGLIGSLLVGVECAKTLSYIYNKPIIGVNHIYGHIYANNIEHDIKFPSLAVVLSGGHSEFTLMDKHNSYKKIGHTKDDAIGETFDKVARILDLEYPGGPKLEKLARKGKNTYNLPIAMHNEKYNLSFSGLKSACINLVHNSKQRNEEINKADLAASFQYSAVKQITDKIEMILNDNKDIKQIMLAGGVAANTYIREQIQEVANKYNIEFIYPKILYCTDNAAMIGAAAYYKYQNQGPDNLNIVASPND